MSLMSAHPLEEILHPKSIAVVGASVNSDRPGGDFITPLLELGFKGNIYPVNPRYSEINGLKAYPSIRDIPGSVDYVISSVPAAQVLKIMEDSSHKGVKAIHFFTARFSETGRQDAAGLERQLLQLAREKGIRIIGPNCMGVYYPRRGMAFNNGFSKEAGAAGLASQSGNIAGEIIQTAALRGVYFSKAISYGNAIDFNESDYLDYFAQDTETKLIMMYVEGVKDGKRFLASLRQATSIKPVIILKGGRGKSVTMAAAAHTFSMAGSVVRCEAAVRQAGAISVENFDDLINLTAAFYFLPPIKGRRVGVAGGAGGASVLAADQCEGAGLDVVPLPAEIREELKKNGVAIWDWIGNPADMSIRTEDTFHVGTILQMMAKNQNFDFLIAIMYGPGRRGQSKPTAETYLENYSLQNISEKPVLAVVVDRNINNLDDYEWSRNLMREVRMKLIAANIPFYPNIGSAAKAVSRLIDYYQG